MRIQQLHTVGEELRIAAIGPYPIARTQNAIPTSGPSNSVHDLALALARRSNDVCVLTHAGLGYQGRGLLFQVGDSSRTKKVTFSGFARKLLAGAFDIVSLQGISPLNALWRMAGRDRILFSPRGLVTRERLFGLAHGLTDLVNERISFTTPWVIAQSSVQRLAISADYGLERSRILVIPNGVNKLFLESTKEPGRLQSEGNILFVGKIGYWKGLDFFLESVDLALRTGVRLPKVVLLGEPTEWLNSLRRRFEHLFRLGIVVHVLAQPRSLLRDLYRDASIFVLPSRWDAFGNTAIEAMASGTPVIVSDRVGMCDLIEDGKQGFIVPFGDTRRMVSRISYLLSHEDVRCKMAEHARETASQFTWDRTASLYEAAFLRQLNKT